LRPRVNLIVAAAAVAVALGGCGGPIQSDGLGRSVDTLTSSAGEGELIARGAAEDRTKSTFVRARAREIGEVVDHEAEKLSDAEAPAELAREKAAAIALAERIASPLQQLQISPQDELAAARAQRQLSRLADQAERLAGSL
jgi:hypothetical protein